MDPMRLRREVLPPRQALSEPCDLMAERQMSQMMARTIWMIIFLTSVGWMIPYLLEKLL